MDYPVAVLAAKSGLGDTITLRVRNNRLLCGVPSPPVPTQRHSTPSCLLGAATVLAIVLAKGQRTPLHFPTGMANKAQPWLLASLLSESKNIVTQYQSQRVSSEKSMMGKCTHLAHFLPLTSSDSKRSRSSLLKERRQPGLWQTDSEKIICVGSLQFADSEKFKCIDYTVLVLNLCFIKKAPANSSSVVLMRWIMRYSKVTNRLFKSHLIHKRNICHQLNGRFRLWSWSRCKRRQFFHADMMWIIDYVNEVSISSCCNENLLRCRQQLFPMESPCQPIRRLHSAAVSTLRLLIGRDSCQSIIESTGKSCGWSWY